MHLKHLINAAVLGLGVATAQGAMAMNVPGPLVTPQWLHAHLNDVTVVDIRGGGSMKLFTAQPQLGKDNMVQKTGGHIAGADLVNFNDIRQSQVVDGVKLKAMMPTAEYFTKVMDDAGVNSGKPIIIVPTGNAVFAMDRGTRLYFQLRYFGVPHSQVAILNGGTNAWINAGYPVSTSPAPTATGDWKAKGEDKAILASLQEVKYGLQHGEQFIDARPTAQYLGIAKKPINKTAGHLAGAKSFPIDAIVKNDHGAAVFMSAADYKRIFADYGIKDYTPTTTYCNTGHLASGAWFVVHEILGNKRSKLYAGSMNEWTNLGNPTVGLPG